MVETPFEEKLSKMSKETREYCLRALPYHLTFLGRVNDVSEVLCDLGFIRANCQAGGLPGLLSDFSRALEVFDEHSLERLSKSFFPAAIPRNVDETTQMVLEGRSEAVSGPILNFLRNVPEAERNRYFEKPLVSSEESLPEGIFPGQNTASEIIVLKKRISDAMEAGSQGYSESMQRLRAFAAFAREHAHLIGRNPDSIVQAAYNWARKGVVAEAAQRIIDASEPPCIVRHPKHEDPNIDGPCLKTLVSDYTLRKVAFSKDAMWAASAASKIIVVWNLREGVLHRTITGHESEICSLVMADDASLCISLDISGRILVRNPIQDSDRRVLTDSANNDRCLAATANGACILSTGKSGDISLWSLKTGQRMAKLNGHHPDVSNISISPDGQLAMTGAKDGYARVWDVASRICVRSFFAGTSAGGVTAIALARGARIGCTGHEDKVVRIWNLETGQCLRRFKDLHRGKINAIAISEDGTLIVSGDTYRRICVWDALSGGTLQVFDDHTQCVSGLALAPNGRIAVSAGYDGMFRMWDLALSKPGKRLRAHRDTIHSLSISSNHPPSDGPALLSAGGDRKICLWKMRDGRLLKPPMRGHQGSVNSATFLSKRGRCASSGHDGTIRLWNLRYGTEYAILTHHGRGPMFAAFNGHKELAITVRGGIAKLWDLEAGREIGDLQQKESRLIGAAWIAGTDDLMFLHNSGWFRIYAARSREIKYEWRSPLWDISSSALSDDGEFVAVSGDPMNSLRVYALRSGECVVDLGNYPFKIRGVAFSHDNASLFSYDHRSQIRIHRLKEKHVEHVFNLPFDNGLISHMTTHQRSRFLLLAQRTFLVLIDLIEKKMLPQYLCESEITALSEVTENGNTVCGTRLGQLHFLKLRDWAS